MQQPPTIKLFLPTGRARSLRTAEISNCSGKAIAGPRSEIEDILKWRDGKIEYIKYLFSIIHSTRDV